MTKRCPRCDATKSLDAFYVLRDGRASGWCRACVSEDKRLQYAARPDVRERAIAQAKKYREQHRERLAEAQREWEQRNAERRREQRHRRADRGAKPNLNERPAGGAF